MVNTKGGFIKASRQPKLKDLCVFVAVDLKLALNSMRSRLLKCVRMWFIMQSKNALSSQCCHRGGYSGHWHFN